MFGSCALNREWLWPLLLWWATGLLCPSLVQAQGVQATVIQNGALVYKNSDFDAPVIDTLKRGAVHTVSKTKKGAFHKIRIKAGTVGWIADTDIRFGVIKFPPPAKVGKESKSAKESRERQRRRQSFASTKFRGPSVDFINYTEETMGQERSDFVPFYGIKVYGEDTLFQGEIYAEGNIQFAFTGPKYYEEVTGKPATGFIFLGSFLFQTATPMGKNSLRLFGLGPMFKYAHLNLQLPSGTKTLNYSAHEMTAGAVFNLGFAQRLGRASLRLDAKYYWERTKYYGLGLSLGWDF